MGEPIKCWVVYRVACPDDANRWSCFADEINARSICACANKACGDGTWDVRAATLGDDASAYHRGLTDAAGMAHAESQEYTHEGPRLACLLVEQTIRRAAEGRAMGEQSPALVAASRAYSTMSSRARRWEAAARRWWQDLGDSRHDAARARRERDTARRELVEVRKLVEEHRKRKAEELVERWSSYGDGACDALDELSDALAAALKGTDHV